jgi:hypothetical protein
MPIADLSDVNDLAHKDSDVKALVEQLKRVIKTYGVSETMRIVASLLSIFRRKNFIKAHELSEAQQPFPRVPSVLANKAGEAGNSHHVRVDHVSLWKKNNRPYFFTSEPYFMSKKDMKDLIAHCDEFDIDFQVDAESFYYPGHCIRILFKRGTLTPNDATAHEDVDVEGRS